MTVTIKTRAQVTCLVRPLKPSPPIRQTIGNDKIRYMPKKKLLTVCRTQNISCLIVEILKEINSSSNNQIVSCQYRVEFNISDISKCCCFFDPKSNIASFVTLLNAAGSISGVRTKSVVMLGIKDVTRMVIRNQYPMLSCQHPDLAKNLMFEWERRWLGRSKFNSKLLNHDAIQPTSKQHQNFNMNNDRQRFTFAI